MGANPRFEHALLRLRAIGVREIVLMLILPPALLVLPDAAEAAMKVGPRSDIRTFVITETSCLVRFPPGPEGDDRYFALSFDLGVMTNVSENSALGLTPFFASGTTGEGNYYVNGGIRGRYRRWLGTRSSFELAPGIILGEARSGEALTPGYSLRGSVSPTRTFTFTAEIFQLRREEQTYHESMNSYSTATLSETGLLLGVTVGRLPGLLGGLVAGYGALVAGIGVGESSDTVNLP